MEYQTRFIEFGKTKPKDGIIDGYGSVFGVVDTYKTVFERGCFARTLQSRQMASMFMQHDSSMPIGAWQNLEEDAYGLRAVGQLAKSVIGEHAAALFEMDAIRGLSVGFWPKQWREDGGITYFTDVELDEISLVCNPSNKQATAQLRNEIKTIREFESVLQSQLGFSARQAKAIAANGFKGSDVRDEQEPESTPNVRDERGQSEAAKLVIGWAKSLTKGV